MITVCDIVTQHLKHMVKSNILLHDTLFETVSQKLNALKELRSIPHSQKDYNNRYLDWNAALIKSEQVWNRTSTQMNTISSLTTLKQTLEQEH